MKIFAHIDSCFDLWHYNCYTALPTCSSSTTNFDCFVSIEIQDFISQLNNQSIVTKHLMPTYGLRLIGKSCQLKVTDVLMIT